MKTDEVEWRLEEKHSYVFFFACLLLCALGIVLFFTRSNGIVYAESVANNSPTLELSNPKSVYAIKWGEIGAYYQQPATTLPTGESTIEKKQNELSEFYLQLKSRVERIKERQRKITRLVKFLKAQGSPVATDFYAGIIIDTAEKSGADYRILVGIMGVESGFCRVNYKKYNCFGYLNNVQYGSYEAAFKALIPKISAQYVRVYGTNFLALEKAYGVQNYEYHSQKLASYYAQLGG